MSNLSRRGFSAGAAAYSLSLFSMSPAKGQIASPDVILANGKFSTMDPTNPHSEAAAITAGRFSAVGDARQILQSAGPSTRVIDLGGRRAVPGLIDSHLHLIREGSTTTWSCAGTALRSLSDAMAMLRRQVAVTPAAAMGAGRRGVHGASVRREAAAHPGRAQRRRARHARLHPSPL
jgi:predicted amidohydrolase YtcJ